MGKETTIHLGLYEATSRGPFATALEIGEGKPLNLNSRAISESPYVGLLSRKVDVVRPSRENPCLHGELTQGRSHRENHVYGFLPGGLNVREDVEKEKKPNTKGGMDSPPPCKKSVQDQLGMRGLGQRMENSTSRKNGLRRYGMGAATTHASDREASTCGDGNVDCRRTIARSKNSVHRRTADNANVVKERKRRGT